MPRTPHRRFNEQRQQQRFDGLVGMVWAETRRTIREEDKAYSLLGVLNICMPLIYGESEKSALRRLRGEIFALEGELNLPFAIEAPFNVFQR